jgi:hypothetical protein
MPLRIRISRGGERRLRLVRALPLLTIRCCTNNKFLDIVFDWKWKMELIIRHPMRDENHREVFLSFFG